MSIRTSDASIFSLRTVVKHETNASQIEVPVPSGAIHAVTANEKAENRKSNTLNFNFSSLPNAYTRQVPSAPVSLQKEYAFTPSLKNTIDSKLETSRAEVVRLVSLVDDLNARCKNANQRASDAEANLFREKKSHSAERISAMSNTNTLTERLQSAKIYGENKRIELDAANTTHNDTIKKLQQDLTVALAENGAQQEKIEEIQTLHTDLKLSRKQTVDVSEELIKSSSINADMQQSIAHLTKENTKLLLDVENAVRERDDAIEARNAIIFKFAQKTTEQSVMVEPQVLDDTKPILSDTCDTMCAPPNEYVKEHDAENPMRLDECTVDMHTEYEKLRTKVLSTSHQMEQMEACGSDAPHIKNMRDARDKMYVRAVTIKAMYDKKFEPHKQAASSYAKSGNRSSVVLYGARPTQIHKGVSMVHKMAARRIFGSTLNTCVHDCKFDIGNTWVKPLAEQVSDFVGVTNVQSDAQTGMINAIIMDLGAWIQNELSDTQSTQVSM
jgi:hypothetical protein